MLLYTLYLWLRDTRHGRLERERKRACMVVLTILSLLFLQARWHSVAIDTWVEATGMAASNARTLAVQLARAGYAPEP